MTTLKKLIDESNIPAALIRTVVKQFGGWDTFTERAPEVCEHGANCGWRGFTYMDETVSFAIRNQENIAKLAEDMADGLTGDRDAIALVRGFNCFRDDVPSVRDVALALYGNGEDDDRIDEVRHALAWFAAEKVCHAYGNMMERVQDGAAWSARVGERPE